MTNEDILKLAKENGAFTDEYYGTTLFKEDDLVAFANAIQSHGGEAIAKITSNGSDVFITTPKGTHFSMVDYVGCELFTYQPEQIARIKELEEQLHAMDVRATGYFHDIEKQALRIAKNEESISEQLLAITALNNCIGGQGSLTTDNLSAIGQLENDLEQLTSTNTKLTEQVNLLRESLENNAQECNRWLCENHDYRAYDFIVDMDKRLNATLSATKPQSLRENDENISRNEG